MKRFLAAAVLGLIAGVLLIRLARRPLLSEELSEESDIEDAIAGR